MMPCRRHEKLTCQSWSTQDNSTLGQQSCKGKSCVMPDLASKRQFDVEYSHTLTATGEKFDYALALSQDSEGLRYTHLFWTE